MGRSDAIGRAIGDLTLVVGTAACDRLPEAIKAGIVALVNSAGGRQAYAWTGPIHRFFKALARANRAV